MSVSPSTPFVRCSGFICRFPLASPRASPFLLFLVATVLRFPVAERFQFSRLESTHVYDTQPNGDGATASAVAAILALRGIASATSWPQRLLLWPAKAANALTERFCVPTCATQRSPFYWSPSRYIYVPATSAAETRRSDAVLSLSCPRPCVPFNPRTPTHAWGREAFDSVVVFLRVSPCAEPGSIFRTRLRFLLVHGSPLFEAV